MVSLDSKDRDRIYFHCGYGAAPLGSNGVSLGGIPAPVLAQVEEAINNILSLYLKGRVEEQLDICDTAFKAMQLANTDTNRFSVKELISGDTNRGIERQDVRDVRRWKEEYLDQVDELCLLLAIPNFRRDSYSRWRFERAGTEYVKAIPGPADTSIASSRIQYRDLASCTGY